MPIQWLDRTLQHFARYRQNEESSQRIALFQVSFFRLVSAYIHEIAHLIITFIGHGRSDTPPQASGGRWARQPDTSEGEAGEFIERAMFGGVLDFYRDRSPLGESDVTDNLDFGEMRFSPNKTRSDIHGSYQKWDSLAELSFILSGSSSRAHGEVARQCLYPHHTLLRKQSLPSAGVHRLEMAKL